MPDAPAVPAAPAAAGQMDGKPAEPNKETPDGSVSKAEFQTLSRTLMSEITTLKGLLVKPADPAPKPTEGERVTLASLQQELAAEKKAREEVQAQTRTKLARAAYKDALTAAGVNDLQAKDLAKNFVSENATKIRLGDDDAIKLEDAAGGMQDIGEVVKVWLGTPHGKTYLPPPKPGPDGEGMQGGKGGTGGKHPFSAMTYEEIGKAKEREPGLFRSYISGHKAEFEAKKQAALRTK